MPYLTGKKAKRKEEKKKKELENKIKRKKTKIQIFPNLFQAASKYPPPRFPVSYAYVSFYNQAVYFHMVLVA